MRPVDAVRTPPAVLPLLLLGACTHVGNGHFGYAPLGAAAPHFVAGGLAVEPFDDRRAERTFPSQRNATLLLFVPLVPSETIPYERLDESRAQAMRQSAPVPTADELFPVTMARAVADDLAASGLFRDVRFDTPADADYVLTGVLRSTRFEVWSTSYMLGVGGMILWFAPLPIGGNSADVQIDLALRDRDGLVVWQYALRAMAEKLFFLYDSGGADVSDGERTLIITHYGANDAGIDPDSLWAYHAAALRHGMAEAKASLAAFLAGGADGPTARAFTAGSSSPTARRGGSASSP